MKTFSNHFSENVEGSLLIPYQSLQGLPKGETHHTFQREKNVHLTGQYMWHQSSDFDIQLPGPQSGTCKARPSRAEA